VQFFYGSCRFAINAVIEDIIQKTNSSTTLLTSTIIAVQFGINIGTGLFEIKIDGDLTHDQKIVLLKKADLLY
jgi:hypothetical protein